MTPLLTIISLSDRLLMSTPSSECLSLEVRASFPAKMTRRVREQKLPANTSCRLTSSPSEGPVDTHLVSKIINLCQIRRRWTFTQKLAVIAGYLQKRKRKVRGDHRSVNFFANMMNHHVKKKNRAYKKLLNDYTIRHKKLYQSTLRLLKLVKDKRIKMWHEEMQEYWVQIRKLLAKAFTLLLWD